ncbi:hypothetical protein WMO79_20105 [Micrococcaceae bacterium Sec7.4]
MNTPNNSGKGFWYQFRAYVKGVVSLRKRDALCAAILAIMLSALTAFCGFGLILSKEWYNILQYGMLILLALASVIGAFGASAAQVNNPRIAPTFAWGAIVLVIGLGVVTWLKDGGAFQTVLG